jgi:hypothetical protein
MMLVTIYSQSAEYLSLPADVKKCCLKSNGAGFAFKSDLDECKTCLASIDCDVSHNDKDEWIKDRLERRLRIESDAFARQHEENLERESAKGDYSNKVAKMIKSHGWEENVLMRIPRYVKIHKGKIKTITGRALVSSNI